MTDPGDTADDVSNAQAMKAGFVRLLSGQVQTMLDDPKQMRAMVYELARTKLLEHFTHENVRESRDTLQVFDRAAQEVERHFERKAAREAAKSAPPAVVASPPPSVAPLPPPLPAPPPPSRPIATEATTRPAEPARPTAPPRPVVPSRPVAPPRPQKQAKRTNIFGSFIRLAATLIVIAGVGAAVAFWPRLRPQLTALSQLATSLQRGASERQSQAATAPAPAVSETAERATDSPKDVVSAKTPSMPLPATFGVYALSEGELQELKALPGKVPDRRVAISAAITTPSATTLTSGDVKFVVFKPEGGIDGNATEVRVVAKVSRSMGVDASGKAAMVNVGDSWVIRSMSFPYKVGPMEEQPRMILLQPEQDGFALTPGRYVVVVKGIGFDFTVAGDATDPAQCVERFNATNGAFYSPCPPRH